VANTYRELLINLIGLPDEQLDSNITVFVPGVDEYYPARLVFAGPDCDVLDPLHPVIAVI
jgi:hypothetical protein